jgi:glycosyltransferase involved in cell wall biosynthesis
MKGCAYERRLRRLAVKVTNVRVDFTGHVTGEQKAALLRRADLFVSPSRHESYGLTIAEAAAAGCRVISHNHYGASGQIIDCSDPAALAAAISAALGEGRTQKNTTTPPPSRAAEEFAALLEATASRCLHSFLPVTILQK